MPQIKPTDEQLRAQIEAVAADRYPSDLVEERIARALINTGRFEAQLDSEELALVLRRLVYTVFSNHRLAGQGINLVHNVATMRVGIREGHANVSFIVHIHKPITAFLKFKYVLINDPVAIDRRLRLKQNSLVVEEHTRRFDFKAKAALATINVKSIARQELADPAQIIQATLPARLERQGLTGQFTCIEMSLDGRYLDLCLEGHFKPVDDQAP